MMSEEVIKLDDVDFYKWMFLNEVVSRRNAELEALRSQREMAVRNANAFSIAMAKKYNITFDKYDLDPATQSLIPYTNKEENVQNQSTSDPEGIL